MTTVLLITAVSFLAALVVALLIERDFHRGELIQVCAHLRAALNATPEHLDQMRDQQLAELHATIQRTRLPFGRVHARKVHEGHDNQPTP